MAKKLVTQVKLQIQGGAATPAPPVGPALGQHGLPIGEFVKQFNDATQDRRGEVVPVVINVYDDRSFTFITKIAPASELIKKIAGIKSGSGKPLTDKVATITRAQLKEVAMKKMPDLNTTDVEAAMKIIEGTCRQMGVDVK
ncbi:50S ribosomal protein L11 [Candidatus Uhrbacteria bacterium RIFCSPHIGHO2_02_FULL_47_44]|uniref:Large ribosomal subunit protein uL11 n=1 Tax=Candidatus Uhrbacteria bacterium RIFCSPLOWO2_02_FULL_48_18 TaxID=1802408 RepID=A0A1F7VAB5_9BACT|nr:MAG: 50S ribosomal protein L11 [Candidatus Uhrbacteria bacterium RIFCSPHIGHO2_01_FULL_47_10]OGL70808.1 MAG: 50S ribosomal protein L11 [Candidatus Uhrbacteria bacterium RIFCSPHIGHO2_02_FULL_47_44]OGL77634.1 MAG: 50S ribosomal protein L11 [Candidatus Uhrbacteria bacterium RIFCSPHIGHO2_12_FULL_47_12]OGL82535.1 MAG: 50S ribosomal protein L11 [Candidatus Uhrbacteria bacterium RIFCSPLOWO2_01_FULL_47_17]OGL86914.1 MAG: 50S ribosomal protein L11 [Candidatus Uhrbacteria bacterium RIFCSPLOWO2_02_FULL_